MATPSVEDYVKAIYTAHAEHGNVASQELAERLGVSAPAVSKMLRRLAELKLTIRTPHQGVRLTRAGERMALEIIRHHRLLERYLVQAMGYSWDRVHEEAERLEHHISEEFEDRIDVLLGHPATCPHGDPIPTRAGTIAETSRTTLAEQRGPCRLVVRRVHDANAALLRHFAALGILPGAAVEFVAQEPFGGAFVLRIGETLVKLTPRAATQVFVDVAPQDAEVRR